MSGISRRRTLQGLGLAAAGALLPATLRVAGAQGRQFDTDVAIVGAGAAGLACARTCGALGRSFVLVEARDRIGGRVFTDMSLGVPLDAGALYIHWAERNPWRTIAETRGIKTVDNDTLPDRSLFFTNDHPSDRPGRRRSFAELDALFDGDGVPDVPMTQRAGDDPDLQRGAEAIARMALGDEPERISALDYARLWSGTDLLVPDGYGNLVTAWGADLPVRLATPVRRIAWGGAGVRIETAASGSFTARAVVVTVPHGVLAAERIAFDPPLPRETLKAIDGLEMGALTKIGLRFDGERFGLTETVDLWDQLGPRAGFDFECWPFGRDLVTVYFGGDQARDLTRLGEAAAVEEVVARFGRLVGADARKHLAAGKLYAWNEDAWSLGCYAHARPGSAGARAALARPVADRLFFAGEATGGETPADMFGGAMTAGGAFLAGRAAAKAVHAALGT